MPGLSLLLMGLLMLPFAGLLAEESAQAEQSQPTTARQQLSDFADGLEDLQASFKQMIRASDGQLIDNGEGQVWLQTPNRLRWQYLGEFPELIVADGKTLWLYDETLEQVTVKAQSELAANSPLMLLTDPEGLERQFQFAELGNADGLYFLELTAKASDLEFDRVMIGFKDGKPVNMALEDAFGMRTDIEFLDLQRNPGLAAGHFDFEPPPGTDVIGELPQDLAAEQ